MTQHSSNPRPTRRVLIVEDDIDLASMLAGAIRRQGHQVDIAHAGRAGLDAARRAKPDLVLLDLGLPDIDGFDVAKALRMEFARAQMLIIAITGWAREKDRALALEAGIDHQLVKPLDPSFLTSLLGGPGGGS